MTWRAPTRLGLIHYPDVVMRLALALLLDRAIGDEIKMLSISGDVGIGVLVLTRERRNLWLRPTAVLVARSKDGPTREIRRHLEEINLAAIRRKRRVRFVVARRDNTGRKYRRVRERFRGIVRCGLRN